MNTINISILTCVHIETHVFKFIKTIDSIFEQGHIPNEIIIIKNGILSDELDSFIEILSQKKHNIRSLIINENNGLAYALNEALKICSNELVGRVDPGDKILNDRFFYQKKFLDENSDVSICGTQAIEIRRNNQEILNKPVYHKNIIKSLKFKNPIIHSTVVFRKLSICRVGKYPLIDRCQDYFLWVKCFEFGLNFHNLPKIFLEVELDDDMMHRRNFSYFLFEMKIYNYMLKKDIIGPFNYLFLIISRFTLRNLPNFLKIKLYNLR